MSCDIVILCDLRGEVALATHTEIATDEWLQVAVEDLVDIADFDASSEVFRHAVGLQDVAADLRAELDVELRVFKLASSGFFSCRARTRRAWSASSSWRAPCFYAGSARSDSP